MNAMSLQIALELMARIYTVLETMVQSWKNSLINIGRNISCSTNFLGTASIEQESFRESKTPFVFLFLSGILFR